MLSCIFVACNDDDKKGDTDTNVTTSVTEENEPDGTTATTEPEATTTAKTTSPWDNGKFSENTSYAQDSNWTPEF